MASRWVVLYDIGRDGPGIEVLFPLVGLAILAIAVVATRAKHFSRDDVGETRVVRGSSRARALLVFAVLWLALTTWSTVVPWLCLRKALQTHTFESVTGSVVDYERADILRKTPERWTVAGRQYEIHHSRVKSGFDAVGIIQSGMYVRLADVNGELARVEVWR